MHGRFSPHRFCTDRSAQGLVEYALGVAAFVLVLLLAVSVLNVKQVDALGMAASTMPGAHPSDNTPITAGELVDVNNNSGELRIDTDAVLANSGHARLGQALGDPDAAQLIVEDRVH